MSEFVLIDSPDYRGLQPIHLKDWHINRGLGFIRVRRGIEASISIYHFVEYFDIIGWSIFNRAFTSLLEVPYDSSNR